MRRWSFLCAALWFPIPGLSMDDIVVDAAPEAVGANVVFSKAMFDSLTGGSHLDYPLRDQLQESLEARLKMIDKHCPLTNDQVIKLKIAGQGDMHHILNEVERLRRKYSDTSLTREGFGSAEAEITRCVRIRIIDPHGENSLFFKVLRHNLTEAQRGPFEAFDRAERQKAIGDAFDAVFRDSAQQPGRGILTDRQSQALEELSLAHFPSWRPSVKMIITSQYVALLIAIELGDELKPILSDEQLKYLKTRIALARGMEPRMRALGMWPLPRANRESAEP